MINQTLVISQQRVELCWQEELLFREGADLASHQLRLVLTRSLFVPEGKQGFVPTHSVGTRIGGRGVRMWGGGEGENRWRRAGSVNWR